MKIAWLQMNPIPGDIEGNCRLIAIGARQAQTEGVELMVTPELSAMGYLPRDLLMNSGFVERSRDAVCRLAEELTSEPAVLVGLATKNNGTGRSLFNSAALLVSGGIAEVFHKSLLPTYDVFDEDRYFEPVRTPQVLQLGTTRLGISICEDAWNDRDFWSSRRYEEDPVEKLAQCGVHALINLSASPFTAGKHDLRERMLAHLARKYGIPVAYVNQVGGNDDLVFDGRSCVFGFDGRLVARARAFACDLLTVDLDALNGRVSDNVAGPEEETWSALVIGLRDYVRKSQFSSVVIGLSGGIDSAVTAAIAVDALGAKQVLGVLMPSPYSSSGSIDDSLDLAQRLGIRAVTLPISALMETYDSTLRGVFDGLPRDVTEENLQARIRGTLLMGLSNKFGYLLITTGNKSELAVGYCTLYGDMSGGIAIIGDVPKTMVYRLAAWRNRHETVIPEPIMTKPPSAELRPNQTDQDALPPYEVLDDILEQCIERCLSAEQIVENGHDATTVCRVLKLVKNAEFKRKQAPPSLKVTSRAFGTGWRMPLIRKE